MCQIIEDTIKAVLEFYYDRLSVFTLNSSDQLLELDAAILTIFLKPEKLEFEALDLGISLS